MAVIIKTHIEVLKLHELIVKVEHYNYNSELQKNKDIKEISKLNKIIREKYYNNGGNKKMSEEEIKMEDCEVKEDVETIKEVNVDTVSEVVEKVDVEELSPKARLKLLNEERKLLIAEYRELQAKLKISVEKKKVNLEKQKELEKQIKGE